MRIAIIQRRLREEDSNLHELKELSTTAGYDVVYSLLHTRPPHAGFNIGPGKVDELRKIISRLQIEKVVFENEIKPVQEYNLAKQLGVPVLDRIQLILEIFAKHASSQDAKLQIKLAELRYQSSRAREKVRLAKKGEQPGFSGLGAYDADIYYDEVSRRITTIVRKLSAIKKRKENTRINRERHGIPSISMVGYTNAGKSTLFNRIANESVPVSDQLFTTLSTTTRLAKFDGKYAFISDTVGFIKNLPTLLVDAFHSTLGEIVYSDLVLLVADLSDAMEKLEDKIDTSLAILREIGILGSPILLVLNKCDTLSAREISQKIEYLNPRLPHVSVSALNGANLEILIKRVAETLTGYVKMRARVRGDDSNMSVISEICEKSRVIGYKYVDGYVELNLEAPYVVAEKLRKISDTYDVDR